MAYVLGASDNKTGRPQEGDLVISEDLRAVYRIENKTGTRRRIKDPAIVKYAVERVKKHREEKSARFAEQKAVEQAPIVRRNRVQHGTRRLQ